MKPTPTIEDLPDPIIEYILSYLSPYRDLKQCSLVNKAWYRYVCDVVRKTQRDFLNAVSQMSVEWCHLEPEPGPTITKRYSHSACCSGNSMYIFGGCTTANTTFNDLWRLDLGTRRWIRPLATGTYPPPKACATLVNHGDNLILFGGWTHTAPYPLHQVWRVFNQIHAYNTVTNRWTQITSATTCPPMAGHSATVHRDYMIVFGGIQKQVCDGPFQSSNDVWILDLKSYIWHKKVIASQAPPPRYGHSQIIIDKDHLLIMGGCGGPNMLFQDIWLLSMNDGPGGTWEWKKMEVITQDNGAPHLTFHPACKVGNQVVVMSKSQKSRSSPSSLPHLLRAPSQIWVPPRLDHKNGVSLRNAKRPSSEVEPCVNGRRGVLKRPADRQNNLQAGEPSSSDEEDPQASSMKAYHKYDDVATDTPALSSLLNRVAKASVVGGASGSNGNAEAAASGSSYHDGPPRDGSSQGSSNNWGSGVCIFPGVSRRQRQLEGLDRMEQRLRELRAGAFAQLHGKLPDNQIASSVVPAKRPMCLYVLDISNAIQGTVTWKSLKNQSSSSPEDIILYSLVLGKGELIMFGGIQKDLNSRQQEGESIPEVVSNSLHFMTAERFVI